MNCSDSVVFGRNSAGPNRLRDDMRPSKGPLDYDLNDLLALNHLPGGVKNSSHVLWTISCRLVALRRCTINITTTLFCPGFAPSYTSKFGMYSTSSQVLPACSHSLFKRRIPLRSTLQLGQPSSAEWISSAGRSPGGPSHRAPGALLLHVSQDPSVATLFFVLTSSPAGGTTSPRRWSEGEMKIHDKVSHASWMSKESIFAS